MGIATKYRELVSLSKAGPAGNACPRHHLTLLAHMKAYNEIASCTAYHKLFQTAKLDIFHI